MTDGERLAVLASRYQSGDTIVTGDGSAKLLLLKRDPRRLYIKFRSVGGIAYMIPFPGEIPPGAVATRTGEIEEEFKVKESPGLVTGEWYAIGTDIAASVEIITDTYVGD